MPARPVIGAPSTERGEPSGRAVHHDHQCPPVPQDAQRLSEHGAPRLGVEEVQQVADPHDVGAFVGQPGPPHVGEHERGPPEVPRQSPAGQREHARRGVDQGERRDGRRAGHERGRQRAGPRGEVHHPRPGRRRGERGGRLHGRPLQRELAIVDPRPAVEERHDRVVGCGGLAVQSVSFPRVQGLRRTHLRTPTTHGSARTPSAASGSAAAPHGYRAGAMFRFIRKRFAGSYAAFNAASRW
jgi:hypothetical protein